MTFFVIGNLSQNCIVGTPFLEETKATINFKDKLLTLYENLLTVPLITNTETENVIRTVKKVRIPPFSEVLLPGKMRNQNTSKITTGITEILPSAAHKGILVASVLQDSRNDVLMCRALNPTRHCVYLPANFPFAFLSDIDLCAVGVNAVNFNDHVTETDNVEVNQTDDDDDVKADRPIPSHEE